MTRLGSDSVCYLMADNPAWGELSRVAARYKSSSRERVVLPWLFEVVLAVMACCPLHHFQTDAVRDATDSNYPSCTGYAKARLRFLEVFGELRLLLQCLMGG